MSESRIVLTDRLRAEGRWNEASEFRDRERQRLRDEGWSRREANQESWRLMEEEFPPYDTEGRAFWMALCRFPPGHIPADLQPDFDANWVTYCRLRGYASYCESGGMAGEERTRQVTESRLRAADPRAPRANIDTERTNEFLHHAFYIDQVEGLDSAARAFQEACDRLAGPTAEVDIIRRELTTFVDDLPTLRAAIIKHWPSENQESEDKPPRFSTELTSAAAHAREDGSLGDGQS
jgi:hypothetical protein